jgi:alpha-tubulin suppressor-like RCC1 family protein
MAAHMRGRVSIAAACSLTLTCQVDDRRFLEPGVIDDETAAQDFNDDAGSIALPTAPAGAGAPQDVQASIPIEGEVRRDGGEGPCTPGETATCGQVYSSRGECGRVPLMCSAMGAWPDLGSCAPLTAESCDAAMLDDDCDGTANEDCPCTPGQRSTCGQMYQALGVCGQRDVECTGDGAWQGPEFCAPLTVELCEPGGLDENCDGRVNEFPTCAAFRSLSVGGEHNCGITTNDQLACWGANSSGELGDGNISARSTPFIVPLPAAPTLVSAGAGSTCTRLIDGRVFCWGVIADSLVPTPMAVPGVEIDDLAVQNFDVCYLLNNRTVEHHETTGLGPVTSILVGLDDVASLGKGPMAQHFCVARMSGEARCFGYNLSYQLGDGTSESRAAAESVAVQGIASAVQLAMGGSFTCARRANGTIACWGSLEGSLGDGMTAASTVPVEVAGIVDAVSIAAGYGMACSVHESGSVSCWGRTQLQLTSSAVPVRIDGIQEAISVGAGFFHGCALLDTGIVKCWGNNSSKQLGNASAAEFSSPPVQVFLP